MSINKQFAVLFFVCAAPTLALAEDDCEDAGKLGVMLGQIDEQCAGYKLTGAGRRVKINLATKVQSLGGEACAAKGKVAMLQQMSMLFPRIDEAAKRGGPGAFDRALCGAIFSYLNELSPQALAERSD